MASLQLPHPCSAKDLIQSLIENDMITGEWEKLVIQIPSPCFITTGALAFLCSWGLLQRNQNKTFTAVGDPNSLRYCSRIDLLKHLNIPFEETFERHEERGRFIPLKLIETQEDVCRVVNQICELVISQFENGRTFLPAMEWAVNEVIDNISIHSQSKTPGAVCAQYFTERQRLDIGICDMGIGIKASLSESPHVQPWDSHGSAISKALCRGITRNKAVGQGNGLAGTREITVANGGNFDLWTGNALNRIQLGKDKGFSVFAQEIQGTGIQLQMFTNRPVNLKDTFIEDSGVNYLENIAWKIEEGGLKIKEECIHTGGREPAKRLRLKILNLLPDMEEVLRLDFTGIESTSSSFLDELLSRLIMEIGHKVFLKKIQIIHASQPIIDMANVVIHQRVEDH
ncbi:STAS-like domain-containing protein [Deltaproteobacteria bacterium TL4]